MANHSCAYRRREGTKGEKRGGGGSARKPHFFPLEWGRKKEIGGKKKKERFTFVVQ